MFSIIEDSVFLGAAAGAPPSAPNPRPKSSSCSNKVSTAFLISPEYFSKTKVSAFFAAASFNASASIMACSNMSDILLLLELFVKINSMSYI